MFHLWLWTCVLVTPSAVPTTQPVVATGTKAKVVAVGEERRAIVDPRETDVHAQDSELQIILRLTGRALADARQYGRVELERAVDDTGVKLEAVTERPWSRDEWSSVESSHGGFSQVYRAGFLGRVQRAGVLVSFDLTAPDRKATRIRLLKGRIPVRVQGREVVISLPRPASFAGTTIQDPALDAAGVHIKMLKSEDAQRWFPDSDTATGTPIFELSGETSKLQRLTVIDKDGVDRSPGGSGRIDGDKEIRMLNMTRPLSDDMRLQITVYVDQQTILVPFELKDIRLP